MVISGNSLYETNGIGVAASYQDFCSGSAADCTSIFGKHAIEVQDNYIEKEARPESPLTSGGIGIGIASNNAAAPVLAWNVSIKRNTIVEADGYFGGAMSIGAGWYEEGVCLGLNTVMEQNVVDYSSRTECPGTPGCSGVAIVTARACQTLIDDSNVFEGVAQSILDQGTCSINLGSTPSCDAACSCEP